MTRDNENLRIPAVAENPLEETAPQMDALQIEELESRVAPGAVWGT